jgi:hypothetical protein
MNSDKAYLRAWIGQPLTEVSTSVTLNSDTPSSSVPEFFLCDTQIRQPACALPRNEGL